MTHAIDTVFVTLGLELSELIKLRHRKYLYIGMIVMALMTFAFLYNAVEAFFA